MFIPINPLFLLGTTYTSETHHRTFSSSTNSHTLIHRHGLSLPSPIPEVVRIDVPSNALPLTSTASFSLPAFPTTANPSPTPILDIPPSLLTQIPRNWPYTAHGVGRNAGQTTTYHLTAPHSDAASRGGNVVAVVVASLQWLPRPLGRQRDLDVGRGGAGGAGRIEESRGTAIKETTKATETGTETVLPIGSGPFSSPTTSDTRTPPTTWSSTPPSSPSSTSLLTIPPYSTPPPAESSISTTSKPTVILTGLRPPTLDPIDPAHPTRPVDPPTMTNALPTASSGGPAVGTSSGGYASMFTLS